MVRFAVVVCALLSRSALADDAPSMRTEPLANFAAEARVVAIAPQQPSEDGTIWAMVTLKVARCTGGSCTPSQTVRVLVCQTQWNGSVGLTMGVVRYVWRDKHGGARNWSVVLDLDDDDQRDRFERESDRAVSAMEADPLTPAVAVR